MLALGSELLSGFVLESNSHWLAGELSQRGEKLSRVTILPDDHQEVIRVLREEHLECDHLVVCGGLGPTDDDLTREALSEASGAPLVFSEAAWSDIQSFFASKHKTPTPSNRKQALCPEGARMITNPCGTAPGIAMQWDDCRVTVLPGVPAEFKAMASSEILPQFPKRPRGPIFKLYGLGESNLMDLIRERGTIPEDVEWGTIARPEGITLHLAPTVFDRTDVEDLSLRIRKDLGEYLYAEEDIHPVALLGKELQSRNLTLSTAESCTGGLLASKITATPGSSSYFEGSIVSYSNAVKEKQLGVDSKLLDQHGAVSEEVARAMAEGCRSTLGTDVSISLTGIAGPGGGSDEKPVGWVHYAVATADATAHACRRFFGSRDEVRERSMIAATLLAIDAVKK